MPTTTSIEVERLFIFIGAAYNELNKTLINVVSKHALEDPRAGSVSDANVALHKILSTDLPALREIKSTSIKPNREVLFTNSERKTLCNTINISRMDCSLLLDLMLRFPGLMKVKDNSNYTCIHNANNCCGNCDHSSISCKKKNCSTGCNHACKTCHVTSKECKQYTLICKKCKACLQCNVIQFKLLILNPSTSICLSFMYYYSWKHMVDLRNLYAHCTATKYQEFLDGSTQIEVGVLSFNNEEELKETIHILFSFIRNYMTGAQFKTPFTPTELETFDENISSIFRHGNSLTAYVHSNIEQIIERSETLQDSRLLADILAGMKEETKGIREAKEAVDGLCAKIEILENEIKKTSLKDGGINQPFEIHVSIQRNNTGDTTPMFNRKDLQVRGIIRKLLYNSIKKAIEVTTHLKHGEDYKTFNYFCDFANKESEMNPEKSSIIFKMTINDSHKFPDDFRDEMTDDVDSLLGCMQEQLQEAIQEKIGIAVTIEFNQYKFGSIIIEGIVELQYGEFVDSDVTRVLQLIQEEVGRLYEKVTVQQIPTRVVKHSLDHTSLTIDFSMKVLPLCKDVSNKLEESVQVLERMVTEGLKTFRGAVKKETKVKIIDQQSHHGSTIQDPTSTNQGSAKKEKNEKVELATVIYNYTARENDELNLKVGDIVEILSKDSEISGDDGWWLGRRRGESTVGVFPANYVMFEEQHQNIKTPTGNRSIPEIEFESLSLKQLIRDGAFGRVWRVLWNNKEYAVKIIDSVETKEAGVADFEKEARMLSMLSHPNIAALLAVCRKPPNLCLVMEFAAGGPLNRFLARRKLPPKIILNWAHQIAKGMNYLHNETFLQIIHRDLKSNNILISQINEENLEESVLKITDFGVARETNHTTEMSTAGTYPWMAPEVIRSSLFSKASDVWSYSVVLWELLTGEVPYYGIENLAIAYGVAMNKLTLPVPATCPQNFTHLLEGCWKPNPYERLTFQDILHLLEVISKSNFPNIAMDSFRSIQDNWKIDIEKTFEEIKEKEKEISSREEELVKIEIDQRRLEERLKAKELELEERERMLLEREKNSTTTDTQEEIISTPKKNRKKRKMKFQKYSKMEANSPKDLRNEGIRDQARRLFKSFLLYGKGFHS